MPINYDHFLKLQHNYNLWCCSLENTVDKYLELNHPEIGHYDGIRFCKDLVQLYIRIDDHCTRPILTLTTKELGFSSC